MVQKAAKYFSTAYILLMFCIYPFYLENGYYNIGEAKMHFFYRVSLAAFLVLTILYLSILIIRIKEKIQKRQAYLIDWEQISAVDILMLLYATAVFLSYAFSINKEEALWGAKGWYMGLVLQHLLCVLYFLISRLWKSSTKILYPIMAASAIVFLLGICNRFSFYPIVIEGAQSDFISTLGNINWFCGFLSVVAPLGVGYFVVGQDVGIGKRFLFGTYAFITFVIGFAQGSDSVFLWYGAIFFLLFWIAADKLEYLKRFCILFFLWAVAAGTVKGLRVANVGKFNYETSGACGYFVDSNISMWIALVVIIGYFYLYMKVKTKSAVADKMNSHQLEQGDFVRKKLRKGLVVSTVLFFTLWIILSVANTIIGVPFFEGNPLFTFDAKWGHGRGVTLWTGARIFLEQPLLRKLIGVGPDCFAAASYEIPEVAAVLRDYFGSARLTNAHNECITMLVNVGIVGACSYIGLLITCIIRYIKAGKDSKDAMLYAFAISVAGYFIHNMVSFAQVLNMPFLFIIIGMAEAKTREKSPKTG